MHNQNIELRPEQCELAWILHLARELGNNTSELMDMYYDNEVVSYISKNQIFLERTKHIKVNY